MSQIDIAQGMARVVIDADEYDTAYSVKAVNDLKRAVAMACRAMNIPESISLEEQILADR